MKIKAIESVAELVKRVVLLAFVLMLLLPGTFRVQAQAVHDVAVVDVATVLPYGATEVYPDWKVNITVIVRNEGTVAETFNVTAYCNSTAIGTKTVVDLGPGENETLTFTWIAPSTAWWDFFSWTWILSPANYTIRAEADVVGGETDTDDNVLVDGSVKVRIPGDVDDDGRVSGSDLGMLGWAYKTEYPSPYYNWRCDFNGDGVIDGRDLERLFPILHNTNIIPAIHDVAIVDASVAIPWGATEIYPGWLVNITVVARNWGNVPETFNVTAYANTTIIQTKTITLTSGNSTTITFTWNTTGFALGNYTISAYAWPVLGETDTVDNLYVDGTVQIELPPSVVTATVDIDSNTLNLKSMGEWITCYIELPEGYNVSDIDIDSIRLNDTFPVSLLVVPPVPVPTEIGDYDNDTIPDLMVKFNKTELTIYICHTLGIEYGNVTLTISGNLTDGTLFEGEDTVKVLLPGDVDDDGDVDHYDAGLLARAYGASAESPRYNWPADFNEDQNIDHHDLGILAGYYGKTAV